jgi:tetratricopeptide (TPR) repeat protein
MATFKSRMWDWTAADAEHRRALELSPGILDACYCLSSDLSARGQFTEALAVIDQGIQRNPFSATAHFTRGMVLYQARRFDESAASLARARELRSVNADLILAQVYEATGRAGDAITLLDTDAFRTSWMMALAQASAGRQAEARRILATLMARGIQGQQWGVAKVYAALGDRMAALDALSQAIDSREVLAHFIIELPFDLIRADPRFRALVARLNFPPDFDAVALAAAAPPADSSGRGSGLTRTK